MANQKVTLDASTRPVVGHRLVFAVAQVDFLAGGELEVVAAGLDADFDGRRAVVGDGEAAFLERGALWPWR